MKQQEQKPQPWFCFSDWLAVWPWANCLTSLRLIFLVLKNAGTKRQMLQSSNCTRYLIVKVIETESRMVVAREGGEGRMGSYSWMGGAEFQFYKKERVMEMEVRDSCTLLWIYSIPWNCMLNMVTMSFPTQCPQFLSSPLSQGHANQASQQHPTQTASVKVSMTPMWLTAPLTRPLSSTPCLQ